jgi:uncharacterized YigZ family protein
MLFSDTYKTLGSKSEGEFKDRGSKFIAYAYPIKKEDEVKAYLTQVKKEHYNAAHHCHAFVLGYGQELQKFNDDREPANTAGRPILRTILSKDLTNTLIIVVRYFGGKLLGVTGLINAYETAAMDALNKGNIAERVIYEQYELTVDYESEHDAFRIIKQFGLKVLQHHHSEQIRLLFEVRKSLSNQLLQAINEKPHFNIKFIAEN